MLKKKNIAMVMAAATVATSVAPVFAASLDGETVSTKDSAKLAQLKEEIKGYLDTKYTTDKSLLRVEGLAGTSVYTVTVKLNKENATPITSIKDLEKALVGLTKSTDKIEITVEDAQNINSDGDAVGTNKAAYHKVVDGKIVDCTIGEYKKADITKLIEVAKISKNNPIEELKEDEVSLVQANSVDHGADYVSLKLQNNDTPLVLKAGEAKTLVADGLAITKPKAIFKEDSFGNKLDKDGKITTDKKDYVVLGFEKVKTALDEADYKTEPKKFEVINKEVESSEQAKNLFDMNLDKYTQEGNEIAKFIREYNAIAGEKISVDLEASNDLTLVVKVPSEKEGINSKFTKLVIKGTKNEIAKIKTAIEGAIDGDTATGVEINTLAGLDREATAIEVSKAAFKDGSKDEEQNIVLVSGTSIADGLTATPFAKANKAPVLLTSSDKISDQVMKEIKRVKGAKGKVFLVGGTNSLNTSIEDQLDSQFIKYERIAGADRADTSLKVANKMKSTAKELFITGGYAEADSMSVAAVAAEKGAPILLAGANGLTRDEAKFVSDKDDVENLYVVGGTSHVSADVEKSLASLSNGKVTRLAGDDRQATNAKVIDKFYKTDTEGNSSTIEKIYVAKGNDKGLVDALATGVLAGTTKTKGAVVLVGETLSADQKAALVKNGFKSDVAKSKTQIGYGIADKVWEAINGIKK